ncbi:MAG: hypothetical protein JWQ02_1690 [Capsulimonas sp.]|nr:hypothetical protein [Capsulimonas sp.]
MTSRAPKNISASVKSRLHNLARQNGEELQQLLTRYAIERLLYRLSVSGYREQFLLKGASLFALWTGIVHRPTRDLDLLGSGNNDTSEIIKIFQSVCEQAADSDGLEYLADSIQGAVIREDEAYEGVRITLMAMLGTSKIPMQIDVGFGDAVTPSPVDVTFPTMLDMPAPQLRAYTRETVVAEKFEAMVYLGFTNSRMKDFYDLWYLATHFDFDGKLLAQALQTTFQRRRTSFPSTAPLALTPEFYSDASKQTQWRAFVRKSGGALANTADLEEIIRMLNAFLLPIVHARRDDVSFDLTWRNQEHGWV